MGKQNIVNLPYMGELTDVLQKIHSDNPTAKEITAAKKALLENPDALRKVGDYAIIARNNMIQKYFPSGVVQLSTELYVEGIKSEFDYKNSSVLERTIIDHIINCWLRLNWLETLVTHSELEGQRMSMVTFLDKRLHLAQKRFLRASESLIRIRKSLQNNAFLQVNIATDGGQQINVVENQGFNNNH